MTDYVVTREQQIKELTERVPPILNVDVVVVDVNAAEELRYLIGRRCDELNTGEWQFAGGRMKYTETPQETAARILATELPGVTAQLKRLITAISTMGDDPRANGVTLFYLYEYKGGAPIPNEKQDAFKWVTKEELLTEHRVSWFNKSIVNEIDAAVALMNSTQDEVLVEVDSDDREIGTIVKREAHSVTTRYHRAAHIMIFDSKGSVVLQQRSLSKATSPGKWDMAGGHQAAGQTIEQTAAAELSEEMGISVPLHFASKGLKVTATQAEWYYLFYGISDGPFGFDKNEVTAIGTFEPEKLLAGGYTTTHDILPHVLTYTKELHNVWEPLRSALTP